MQVVRLLAAAAGVCLVLATSRSVLRALLVTRGTVGLLPRLVDRAVTRSLRVLAARFRSYEGRDRILSSEAPLILAGIPLLWLSLYELAYSLLLWPSAGDLAASFREAGSSLLTLGFASTGGAPPTVVDLLAALTGLVVVALQIAYLPTLYGAYNRRETEVTLLMAAAGTSPGGPSCSPGPGTDSPPRTGRGLDILRGLGALGGRRRRNPRQLPRAAALPLAASLLVVAGRAARGGRLRRASSTRSRRRRPRSRRGSASGWASPACARWAARSGSR